MARRSSTPSVGVRVGVTPSSPGLGEAQPPRYFFPLCVEYEISISIGSPMLKKDLSPTNLILNSMSCGFFPLKTGAAHKPTRINKKPTLLIWPACQYANGNTKPLYAGSVLSSCLACLARTLRSFELSDSLLFRASCGLFAFSAVAASHDSFATGLRSGRPIFVLPLLRENKTPGCPIQRVLENDFVVVTGTGTARDFLRLLTVALH